MALTLTRRGGESIRIGDAEVRIQRVHGGKVVVSIEAPRNVLILRSELDEKPERPAA